jgi:hypothetical protein
MRAFALLLILANVAFLTWHQQWLPWLPWQPQPFEQIAPAQPVNSELAQLTLLSERQAVLAAEQPTEKPTEEKTAAPITVPVKTESLVKEESVEKSTDTLPNITVPKMFAEEATQPIKMVEESTKTPVPLKTASEETPRHETDSVAMGIPAPDHAAAEKAAEIVPVKPTADEQKSPVTAVQPVTAEPKPVEEQKPGEATHIAKALAVAPTKVVLPAAVTTEKTEKPTQNVSVKTKQPVPQKKLPVQTKVGSKSRVATMICLQVGPYAWVKTAENTLKWFSGRKNVVAYVRKHQVPVLKYTRVYLPAFKNRTDALNAQQRLLQQGIQDHLVLTGKKLNNAISLGVYRDQLSVKRRLEELASKGYRNVKTEKHYESDTKYGLSVKIPISQSKLIDSFREKFKGIPIVAVACEESLP